MLRMLEPILAEETLAWGVCGGWACSDECTSQCLYGLKWVDGDGDENDSPACCSPLSCGALLLWCPGFLLQTFPVVELLIPVHSGSLHNHQLSPSWVHVQTPLSITQPSSRQKTYNSGWAGQGCSRDHVHSSYFVMPFTDGPPYSPLILWRSLSVPANFPTMRGFSDQEPLLTFSFPSGLQVLFLILFFFFFFFPTPLWGDFSCPFMCSESSSNIQQVLCVRIVPFIDIFLMYWWGDMNSASFSSAILTPLW